MLGWLMALGGIVLVLGEANNISLQYALMAPWWSAIGFFAVGIILLLGFTGPLLPIRMLRVLWGSVIAALLLSQLTVFFAYRGDAPDDLMPWAWAMEPTSVTMMLLLARPAVALGYTVVSALTPLMSGLLFLGFAPAAVAAATSVHVGNIAFVMIFLGIRARLDRLHTIEEGARQDHERRQRAATALRRRQELGRIVHDEVLSTLTAATRLTGVPVPELRTEARRALEVLEPALGTADVTVSTHDARRMLHATVRRISADAEVDLRTHPGDLPRLVVDEIGMALAEATRNSVRHAPDAGIRRVIGRIEADSVRLVMVDDGPGFDITSVDTARMGVRSSILDRLHAVPGGRALVNSGPHGTRVELAWTR